MRFSEYIRATEKWMKRITVRDGELVLIPEGYHPVVAAHGYNIYYLNVLAGSAHSMAAGDDPGLCLGTKILA